MVLSVYFEVGKQNFVSLRVSYNTECIHFEAKSNDFAKSVAKRKTHIFKLLISATIAVLINCVLDLILGKFQNFQLTLLKMSKIAFSDTALDTSSVRSYRRLPKR